MIARIHRFHGHTSLPALYHRAQTVRGQLVSLKYATRRPGQPYRLAVVVSRKVNKSAVVRNQIRRRLYEIARSYESRFSGSYDLIMTIHSDSIATVPHAQLQAQVEDLFNKARVVA
jgi:ribonuclease P protein component